MSGRRETHRDNLFDFAVANPEGFTANQGSTALDCGSTALKTAIRDLRLFLGEFDDINLPCNPQGGGEPWLYQLAGTLDDIRPWGTNRINDAESRIRTIQAVFESIVHATHGNSIAGRKARVIERSLSRLIEDLDTIQLDPGGLLTVHDNDDE